MIHHYGSIIKERYTQGVRYQIVMDPKNVKKWGEFVTTHKNEEPPYKEYSKLKFLKTMRVTHISVDDLTLKLYMRETEEVKHLFSIMIPPPHTIFKDKVLYIYLRVSQIMALTPIFFDKFAILYESIELRAVQDFIWHKMPILELAPQVMQPNPLQKELHASQGLNGVAPIHSKEANLKVGLRGVGRTMVPNTPPIHVRDLTSTFKHHSGVAAHEVPLTIQHYH